MQTATQLTTYEKESIVIASMLSDQKIATMVGATLSPQQFTNLNSVIYRTILSGTKSPDQTIVKLQETGQLDKAGGLDYVSTVVNFQPMDEHVVHDLTQDIIKAHKVRTLKSAVTPVLKADDQTNPDEMVESLIDAIQKTNADESSHIVSMEEAFKLHGGTVRKGSMYTGIPKIDKLMGGITKTDFVIIAARTSNGKTVLANQIMLYNAYNGIPGFFVSLEQSLPSLVRRMEKMVSDVSQFPVYFYCEADTTIDKIYYQTLMAKLRYGIEMVVIDYAQLIGGQPSSMSTTEFLKEVAKKCRKMANSLQVAVILISQINRNPTNTGESAGVHNLKGSGALEETADIIVVIERSPGKEFGEIQIGKHREGDVGRVRVQFDPKRLIFTEVD